MEVYPGDEFLQEGLGLESEERRAESGERRVRGRESEGGTEGERERAKERKRERERGRGGEGAKEVKRY